MSTENLFSKTKKTASFYGATLLAARMRKPTSARKNTMPIQYNILLVSKVFLSYESGFFSDKYILSFTACFSTFSSPPMILCRTTTIWFLSMSVFLDVNFLTRSLAVMGLRIRYLFTSSSVMELVEVSIFCFFPGGAASPPPPVLLSGESSGVIVAGFLAVAGLPVSLSLFLECFLEELLPLFPFLLGLLEGEPAGEVTGNAQSFQTAQSFKHGSTTTWPLKKYYQSHG